MGWINQGQVNGAGQNWVPPWAQANQDGGAAGRGAGFPNWSGDGVQSNWWSNGAFDPSASSNPYAQNTFAGFMASVQNAIGTLAQQFFGTTGSGGASGYGGTAAYGNAYEAGGVGRANGGGTCAGGACERGGSVALEDGTLSSTGDPHLAVTGTRLNPGGTTSSVDSHFDSMSSHGDLFSTNAFGDGFNVATTVTQPNANGVTTNASATATMNGGLDAVSMSLGGGVQVTSGGNAVTLSAGQTITLSGGEQVTENAGGSVTIAEQNAAGSTLDTTFSNGGSGINVTAQAHDVRLRGDVVTGGTTPAAAPPQRRAWGEATPGGWSDVTRT